MINFATDLLPLTVEQLNSGRYGRGQLEGIATSGNAADKETLIDWGYGNLPYWYFEHLYFLATGEEWITD